MNNLYFTILYEVPSAGSKHFTARGIKYYHSNPISNRKKKILLKCVESWIIVDDFTV